jgi:hypothetical protein
VGNLEKPALFDNACLFTRGLSLRVINETDKLRRTRKGNISKTQRECFASLGPLNKIHASDF